MEQEKQPQQAIPPEELAHLADILKMVNAELEEAQLSVERMDEEYREAQEYIASTHGEGDPKGDVPDPHAYGADRQPGRLRWCTGTGCKRQKLLPISPASTSAPRRSAQNPYYIGLYAFLAISSSSMSSTGARCQHVLRL